MIRKILFIIILIPIVSLGQLANSWINYSQSYFKFPVVTEGVYRITFQQLVNAGVNITNVDPRSIQIFSRGEEAKLYIEGESDGVFNSNDFIELYCEPNDGWYDHALFSDSTHAFNPHYSMYTDTAYYFLTWNSQTNNKRLTSTVDLNFNAYSSSPYFWCEVKNVGTKAFNTGQATPVGWAVPEYSEGEGWYDSEVWSQNSAKKKIETPYRKVNGPDGWIKTKIGGLGAYTHFVNIKLNDSLFYDGNFFDRKTVSINESLPNSWLSDECEILYESTTPVNNTKDKFAIAYSEIRYAREYNLGGNSSFMMNIPSGVESKDLLVISNYNNLNSTVRIYDVTGGNRVTVQPLNGKYYALIPNNGIERKCFISSEGSVRTVSSLKPVSGGSTKFINYEEVITTKGGVDYLLLSARQLMNAAVEYGDYRELTGLKTLVVDMDQLYDQFSYGIRKHPMSIRNFTKAVIQDWNFTPEYLFLCGKSIAMNYISARRGNAVALNMVPTWSVLGSDAGLTQNLYPGNILDPALSTGRIAATTEEELRNYLSKVMQYESAEPADWMKRVLHFGGGNSEKEQADFKNFLQEFEDIIEDSLFGGDVRTILKNSSDPLQLNVSDSVNTLINDGVTLMSFFGHAYGNNFDQSIDEPENYENEGKYSFILANSCLIGNIHKETTNSGSERFVLAKDRGAIGFLASSSLGVPSYLFQYSSLFYKKMGKEFYGWPVGKVVQQVVKEMQDSSNALNRDVCLHMTLHCDPAVILNAHPKADYTVYGAQGLSQPNVYFNPEIVTSETDSFSINLIVTNIGKSAGDTFSIAVTRDFPSETLPDTTYNIQVSGIFYKDTISIKMPVDKLNGIGLNSFSVYIDALGEVDELDEINNILNIDLFIKSSDLVPVYPYNYAVVPNPATVLKASTGNPYSELLNYYFEIDTSDQFSSPVKYQEVVSSLGGVIELDPNLSSGLATFYANFPSATTIASPQVFFWRVSLDSTGNGGFNWKESSFQHVTGKSGWGQSHFHQFKNDNFSFLDYNYTQRNLDFIEQTKSLSCKTHKFAFYNYSIETKYDIDGAIQCFHSSHWEKMFFVAVIDKITLEPWYAQDHGDYGHINYADNKIISGLSEYNFYFNMNSSAGVDSLISFVEDVPDSNYVLFYNYRDQNSAKWLSPSQPISTDFAAMLNGVGANVDSLKNYPNNFPYILFFKKGDPSSVLESFSPDGEDFITLKATMKNNWVNGTVKSSVVGPSKEWGSLHYQLNDGELGNTGDTAYINVYGINSDGKETLLIDSLTGTGDILGLNDSINAINYPYLRLESFFADEVLTTPSGIERWQVLYEEVPEAALNPLKITGYTLVDTVQQGEELVFVTAIQNISGVPMDSMQVSYRIIDNEFNNFPFTYKIKQPLLPGEFITDTVVINTTNLIELNNLWYEINPYVGERPWQLEQYHFNNLYLHRFFVSGDERNPLLDVTFDGVRILNGDIVSPKPHVVITLNDENQFLALDDPSLIKLFINYPTSNNTDSLVLLPQSSYTFTTATMPKNECIIEFDAEFLKDGTYEIRIQAQDRSSNASGNGDGNYDYRLSFEVVTESTITQFINYPNPFSTSTRFVFTLTGSEVPDDILIQIMTISGRIVREITKEELGPMQIGRNISEFEWDGTDQYGDKLANGVYLYKVIVHQNGAEMKERSVTISTSEGTTTLSDKYFKNGIGKMYILR